jgi:hypothetical protein
MNGTWLETIHSRCYVFKRDRRTASRWLGIGAATRDEEGKGLSLFSTDSEFGGFNGRISVRERDSESRTAELR